TRESGRGTRLATAVPRVRGGNAVPVRATPAATRLEALGFASFQQCWPVLHTPSVSRILVRLLSAPRAPHYPPSPPDRRGSPQCAARDRRARRPRIGRTLYRFAGPASVNRIHEFSARS